jgi:DNA-binding beta-propeller fold protein YncE
MQKLIQALLMAVSISASVTAQPGHDLKRVKDIPLPGVTGKFDHFAFDIQRQLLFAAATGNHTVEVIDTVNGSVRQSIGDLRKPHGLAWVPATQRLFVADGSLAALKVYEGSPLKLVKSIQLSDDADDMVYDPETKMLFVGHGGSDGKSPGQVAIVDATTLELVKNLPASSHPEALEFDSKSDRIFANIADSAEVLVIDARRLQMIETWKLSRAQHNVPAAYDRTTGTLLLGCRTPSKLLAVDGKTGQELQDLDSSSGADDLFIDSDGRKAYLITGSGHVDVYGWNTSKLEAEESVPTANDAKTGLLVPAIHTLYVGIPSTTSTPASIRAFSTGHTR